MAILSKIGNMHGPKLKETHSPKQGDSICTHSVKRSLPYSQQHRCTAVLQAVLFAHKTRIPHGLLK